MCILIFVEVEYIHTFVYKYKLIQVVLNIFTEQNNVCLVKKKGYRWFSQRCLVEIHETFAASVKSKVVS